jgi:hypothetical protein
MLENGRQKCDAALGVDAGTIRVAVQQEPDKRSRNCL